MKSLQTRSDVVINRADKGGKVVVMDKQTYINNCECQLNDEEFYIKLDHDPTHDICKDINSEIKNMLDDKLIDTKEFHILTEHLNEPRMSFMDFLKSINYSKNFHL